MKNRFTIDGERTTIFLRTHTGGEIPCVIDSEDLAKVQTFPLWWHVRKSKEYVYVEHDYLLVGDSRVRQNMASVVMESDRRIHRRSAGPLNLCKSNLVIGADPVCGRCGSERKPLGAARKLFCLACASRCEKRRRADPDKREMWATKDRRSDLVRRKRDPLCRYRTCGIPRALLRDLLASQHNRCALTGRPISIDTMHLDHIIPIARGGTTVIENLRFVTPEANMAKRHLLDAEFIRLCSDVVQFQAASGLLT